MANHVEKNNSISWSMRAKGGKGWLCEKSKARCLEVSRTSKEVNRWCKIAFKKCNEVCRRRLVGGVKRLIEGVKWQVEGVKRLGMQVGDVNWKSCKGLYIKKTLEEKFFQTTCAIWVFLIEKTLKISLVFIIRCQTKERVEEGVQLLNKSTKGHFLDKFEQCWVFQSYETQYLKSFAKILR